MRVPWSACPDKPPPQRFFLKTWGCPPTLRKEGVAEHLARLSPRSRSSLLPAGMLTHGVRPGVRGVRCPGPSGTRGPVWGYVHRDAFIFINTPQMRGLTAVFGELG